MHATLNTRFKLGILLNICFVAAELGFGIQAHSMALIADALHNAGDVIGLVLAWLGYVLAQKPAPSRFTYSFKNATVIAAFLNGLLLFAGLGGIAWEAVGRFAHPEMVVSETIMIVASIGVCVNGLTAYFFFRERHTDINIRGAFLHMLLDAAVSVGVIITGVLILWTGWAWLDPACSLIIVVLIAGGAWSLFRESLDLMLLAVPTAIDFEKIIKDIQRLEPVQQFHDLHIWPMSTTETALSLHVVVKAQDFKPEVSTHIASFIQQHYPITHVTIQLESEQHIAHCPNAC